MAAMPRHHINDFFARFPAFGYTSSQPLHREFRRLAKEKKWDNKQKKKERAALQDAMVHQFNQTYGKDENALASWQLLCNALGLASIPDNISDCRKLVTSTHVNLVDFVHSSEPGKPVQTFPSEVELSEYTRDHEKYFPRNNIHSGSLLRSLLRHIDNPSVKRGKHPSSGQHERPRRRGKAGEGSRGKGGGRRVDPY